MQEDKAALIRGYVATALLSLIVLLSMHGLIFALDSQKFFSNFEVDMLAKTAFVCFIFYTFTVSFINNVLSIKGVYHACGITLRFLETRETGGAAGDFPSDDGKLVPLRSKLLGYPFVCGITFFMLFLHN
jgi:hypothetical protein